ncbi:Protein crossbronx [Madurella mycetomatis]|uniref:Protein crossbronx n=1 Tax=Madurella mycetomatis TaxID=100816 RepID=A0A175VXI6_9PEZI|nr:Protein crossbronx [Madurella mycetomatis]
MQMTPPAAAKMGSLPAVKRQHLLAEFAGLKQACPHGIYVSLTPGDPTLWSGVIFVRKGPYANAILRFYISFPDTYPSLPPLVTFSTDMFHPLITPLTTYMYSTDVQDGGTVSASDDERLPPGGFSLRHGFPGWFGRRSRVRATATREAPMEGASKRRGSSGAEATMMTPPPPARSAVVTATGTGTPGSTMSRTSAASSSTVATTPGFAQTGKREVSTYEVLRYIRSTFDDEDVLDSVPLEAAGNPGAWHAWRTHRRQVAAAASNKVLSGSVAGNSAGSGTSAPGEGQGEPTARRPDEWNWEGVWEERVKRGIAASLSEGLLYGNAGAADEVINFLSIDDAEVEGAKSRLLRTLGATA